LRLIPFIENIISSHNITIPPNYKEGKKTWLQLSVPGYDSALSPAFDSESSKRTSPTTVEDEEARKRMRK